MDQAPSLEAIIAADKAQIHPFDDLSKPTRQLDVYVRGEGAISLTSRAGSSSMR